MGRECGGISGWNRWNGSLACALSWVKTQVRESFVDQCRISEFVPELALSCMFNRLEFCAQGSILAKWNSWTGRVAFLAEAEETALVSVVVEVGAHVDFMRGAACIRPLQCQ